MEEKGHPITLLLNNQNINLKYNKVKISSRWLSLVPNRININLKLPLIIKTHKKRYRVWFRNLKKGKYNMDCFKLLNLNYKV
jgi:hypothetical protein